MQQGVLEGLKKRADTGDLKDKKAYENYYKSVMPFHITTDVKVSPAPPWYH